MSKEIIKGAVKLLVAVAAFATGVKLTEKGVKDVKGDRGNKN